MTTPIFVWDSSVNKSVMAFYDSATGLPKFMDETTGLPVDVIDRAGRLLGVIYGSQGQKIQQKATTFETIIDIASQSLTALKISATAAANLVTNPIFVLLSNGTVAAAVDAANTARTTGTIVQAVQGVDAAGAVLSTSALATAAKQDTQDASINTLLKPANTLAGVTTVATVTNLAQQGGVAISLNTGVRDTGTQRVTIATNDLVPVSVASIPLPTGAATETTLAALNTKVTTKDLDSGVGTDNRQVVGLVTAASGGAANVPLPDALTTGGGVKVGVVDALPAGANNIGDVDVASSALPTGAATSTKQDTLLAELQLKADLTETQPVSVASLPLPTGAATSAKQDLQPLAATTPTLYNVTMTLADTEYSQALPANTKILEIREQSMGYVTRYAFVTGKVAIPTAPYRTLGAGEVKTLDNLNLAAVTLYFACSTAGKILEIEAWS